MTHHTASAGTTSPTPATHSGTQPQTITNSSGCVVPLIPYPRKPRNGSRRAMTHYNHKWKVVRQANEQLYSTNLLAMNYAGIRRRGLWVRPTRQHIALNLNVAAPAVVRACHAHQLDVARRWLRCTQAVSRPAIANMAGAAIGSDRVGISGAKPADTPPVAELTGRRDDIGIEVTDDAPSGGEDHCGIALDRSRADDARFEQNGNTLTGGTIGVPSTGLDCKHTASVCCTATACLTQTQPQRRDDGSAVRRDAGGGGPRDRDDGSGSATEKRQGKEAKAPRHSETEPLWYDPRSGAVAEYAEGCISAGDSTAVPVYGVALRAVRLVASRVSLPDSPGRVELTSLMPEAYAAKYQDPTQVLRPTPPAPELMRPARVGGSDAEYALLIRRVHGLEMVALSSEPPLVINGVFVVPKGADQQRFIVDARNANLHFVKPEPVALAAPELIAALHVARGRARGRTAHRRRRTLWAEKTDLSDFYHTLLLPVWMQTYFGLPPLPWRDVGIERDGVCYPTCRTLPMGCSHSVLMAQIVHEHVVRRGGLMHIAPPLTRHGSTTVADDLPRTELYIDDKLTFATSKRTAGGVQRQYIATVSEADLRVKAAKSVGPTTGPVDCLGVEVHGEAGTIGVSATKLLALIRDTHDMLSGQWVSGRDVAELTGRWTWAMLIRRPALSVFSSVYRFSKELDKTRAKIWPSAARELRRACYLAPLLYAPLNPSVLPRITASDASSGGFGSVERAMSSERVRRLSECTLSAAVMNIAAARGSAAPDAAAHHLLTSVLSPIGPHLLRRDRLDQPMSAAELDRYRADSDAPLPCVSSAYARDRVGVPGGDVTNPLRSRDYTGAREFEGLHSLYQELHESEWTVTSSGAWGGAAKGLHINEKEIIAARVALSKAVERIGSAAAGKQLLALTDSLVALGVLSKGRASSPQLLRAQRCIASVQLSSGIIPIWRYVTSELNAADGPSRALLPAGLRLRGGGGGGAQTCVDA